MKTINKPGDNLGGLVKIWAIPSDVVWVSGKTVTINDSTNVYEFYCTPETIQHKEQQKLMESGIHYNTIINGFIPKDSESLQEALEYLEPRKWAVIFQDGNGSYKMAGSSYDPLRFSSNLDTGKNTAARAGFSFSFSGISLSRALFVDNPF